MALCRTLRLGVCLATRPCPSVRVDYPPCPGRARLLLQDHEIQELAEYCDFDRNGVIGPADLQHALDLEVGLMVLEQADWQIADFITASAAHMCPVRAASHPRDLTIRNASLPESHAEGIWPDGYQDEISDHAPLSAILGFPQRPPLWNAPAPARD